jgi:uncharacterized protein (TIGR02391 family)
MILTNSEMERVRQCLETQAGLDEELVQRCGHLIHLGAFDEAIRSAFVLLEERLRDALNKEGITGTRLALDAFDPENGPLALQLASSRSERIGLQELYAGAFRLFRNPTAHSVVGYSAAEGKAIIGLVDLLLTLLKRVGEIPPPGLLPENVEKLLENIEQNIGPGAASRFRSFLGRCVAAGLKPSKSAKAWIPFRRRAFVRFDWWDEPKSHNIAVFYHDSRTLSFPIHGYYAGVVGFDVDQLVEELMELRFRPSGKKRDPAIDLRTSDDQAFFDSLYELVVRTADNLEDTLQQD